MRIAFYANHHTYGGLQNNGGTKTILRSAEALRALGHKVDVVARSDKFTYFKHPKPVKKIPKCDVCIAVSVADVPPMVKDCSKGIKKAVWLRGWPVWSMNSKKIVFILKSFADAGNKVFVISKWLQRKCEKKEIKCQLQYAGYDEIWKPGEHILSDTIGVLYHKFHKTKNYDFWRKVRKGLCEDYDYVEVGRKPLNDAKLLNVLQKTGIWFAPTSLEGFHQLPMEANLCGATVVCSNHPRNGMDYANRETAMIYEYGDVSDAVRKIRFVDHEKAFKMQDYIKKYIKTREQNMIKYVEAL